MYDGFIKIEMKGMEKSDCLIETKGELADLGLMLGRFALANKKNAEAVEICYKALVKNNYLKEQRNE